MYISFNWITIDWFVWHLFCKWKISDSTLRLKKFVASNGNENGIGKGKY